ncbi:hypothetical protein FOXB_13026 [Fusarium oxysporum f. sp. conglutinans Fo5176]|uniref:Uncharacterized protein n=1 Tax=Fusarium oxysporum (strain Fo5176) TaxID=660025 RepID=F9G2Z4_FUSOF|nr:hypothetical protein FOXB_13026 [Fusarium oxysporum f. sp. conglutinans Fo5176]
MAMRNFKYRRRIKLCILNYNQDLQQFSNPAGIEDDEIWFDPYLFSEPGQIVNPPQEPHGASQLCRDLPQDIDHQSLGGTTFSHFIQSNTEQESYTYLLPSSDEPMQVASVLNLCGFSFLFTEPFISQRSREEATHLDPKSGERIFSFSSMPPTVLAGAMAKDNSTVFREQHFQYHHLSHFRPRAASGKSTILAVYQSYGSTVMIGLQRMM